MEISVVVGVKQSCLENKEKGIGKKKNSKDINREARGNLR